MNDKPNHLIHRTQTGPTHARHKWRDLTLMILEELCIEENDANAKELAGTVANRYVENNPDKRVDTTALLDLSSALIKFWDDYQLRSKRFKKG